MSPRLDDAPARFGAARVARLATTTEDGSPHLVPVVFAVVGETLWSAVDAKPKSTNALRRLANVAANPAVSLLVDHYDDDWATLWWVRARGTGREVGDADERGRAVALLRAKYPQYAHHGLDGPVLAVAVSSWRGWSATPPA